MNSISTKNVYSVIDIKVQVPFTYKQVLTCKALKFLAEIHLNFNDRRLELLTIRNEKSGNSKNGSVCFSDLNSFSDRKIRVFGIHDNELIRKSFVENNQLVVVDFRNQNTPSWSGLVETQLSLKEIINSDHTEVTLESEHPQDFAIKEMPIVVGGRDLDDDEINFHVDKVPLSASFFDYGLYLFHNAKHIAAGGSVPVVFIPNIVNYYEAKFWNEFLLFVEQELELETGSIKAIVSLDDKLPEFEKRHIKEELDEHLISQII